MFEFTREDFKKIAHYYELRMVSDSKYLLLDCNIMFEFDEKFKFGEKYGYVYAYGVIPMELAVEMYETVKDVKEKTFSNSISHTLEHPTKNALYPSFNIDRIFLMSERTGRSIREIIEEEKNQALNNDYDNCYIDSSYIYSKKAFSWFIETVKNYYSIEKVNTKK